MPCKLKLKIKCTLLIIEIILCPSLNPRPLSSRTSGPALMCNMEIVDTYNNGDGHELPKHN
jgi:hypothetical protein